MSLHPPGEIALKFALHPAQMEVFTDKTRFRVLVAGRRFGKSREGIAEACIAALDPANVQRKPVYMVAPTQPQARLLYWRPLIDILHPLIENTNVNEGFIHLNNGVMIGVKGADSPDSLRGPGLFFAVLDEFASMKPVVWEEIIRPALADVQGRALFLGTPSGRNHFYHLYQRGLNGRDPNWKSFHFDSTANPFLPAGEIEEARRSMSSAAFRQEFEASFETGGGKLFQREWFKYDDKEPEKGEFLMSVDPAGFADVAIPTRLQKHNLDRMVISTVKVEEGGDWWVKDLQIGRWGIKEAARRVVDTLDRVKPAAFGMEGGALYQAILPAIMDEAARRSPSIAVNCQMLSHGNKNKIDRITWALQGRFEHGRIRFCPGQWNAEAEDEIVNFPSRLVHDDIPDALAYIAQLAEGRVFQDLQYLQDETYWEPADKAVGF